MPETPWTSKPVLITGALASAVIIALTVALITTTRDKPTTQTQPAPTSPGATTTTPTTPTGEASICGLTDTNNTIPTTGPVARWSLLGNFAVPSIEGQGPGKIEPDGFRSCYAHTPTGALLAAANFVGLETVDGLKRKAQQRSIAPGKGREIALSKPVEKTDGSGLKIDIKGFKILTYTPQKAVISLGATINIGLIASGTQTLVWSQGDWKIYAPESGEKYSPLESLETLDGYITWSGV